jgi:Tol biopolymer transport system component
MNLTALYTCPLGADFLPTAEPRKIASGERSVWDPVWLSNGDLMTSAGPGGLNLNLIRLPSTGSATPQVLTWAGGGVWGPTLSRAGGRLAYARSFRDSNVWRVDLSSQTPPEAFITSAYRDVAPQYSPDGRRLAFHSDRSGQSTQIWTAAADGSQAARLTDLEGPTTGSPRWSPDSRQISFDSNTGGAWQIYVINADGGSRAH